MGAGRKLHDASAIQVIPAQQLLRLGRSVHVVLTLLTAAPDSRLLPEYIGSAAGEMLVLLLLVAEVTRPYAVH